jgi:hypothetical protein
VNRDRAICVRLMGGLGNQMFQYAVGRATAHRLGVELLVDDRYLQRRQQHSGFALDAFRLRGRTADAAVHSAFPEIKWRVSRALRRQIRPLWGFFHERGMGYDPSIRDVQAGMLLSGFWQSWRYFQDVAPTLREEFVLDTPWPKEAEQLLNEFADPGRGDSVALHVRRGDYAHSPDALRRHGLCTAEYYNQAMSQMVRRVPRAVFRVFSDDPDWVRHNLQLPAGTEFISRPTFRPEHDLMLMAGCRHQIIANSTFSWWAGWLNVSPGKVVIAPSPWFDEPGMDNADRWPEGWLLLDKRTGLEK